MTMDLLSEGTQATIVQVQSKDDIKRRLMDLGIAAGSRIECLNRSPFGDPTAFLVKGTVIALRNDDARSIVVR